MYIITNKKNTSIRNIDLASSRTTSINTNLQLIMLAISEIKNNYFRFDDSILRIITEQISNYPIYLKLSLEARIRQLC